MPITGQLLPGIRQLPTGHNVANSCRFDKTSDDTLNRTQSGAGNRKTWTFSTWIKICKRSGDRGIFSYYDDNNNFGKIGLQGDYNQLVVNSRTSGTYHSLLQTSNMLRDFSAWYNIIVAADTTQGTEANRIKIYINGTQVTSFTSSTYPAQNHDLEFNTTDTNYISNWNGSSQELDGYLAETVFIDGTALAPTDFGEFDEDSPTIWKPIDVSGLTFGNNGFYLQFKQSGTSQNSSGLGADTSGNDNHFAVTNLTAESQTTDTCTNNFCTVNPLDNYHQQATLSEGNTKITFKGPSSYYAYSTGTFGVASGKWYWETKATSAANHDVYGISGRYVIAYNKGLGVNTDEYGYYNYNGNYTNAATDGSYREVSFPGGNVTWTTNDIIGVALDLDSGTNTVKFYKNNALIGTIDIIAPSSGFYYPAWNQFDNQAEVCQPNFGNPSYTLSSAQSDANGYGSFEYAPPSGYFALCSKNLSEFG